MAEQASKLLVRAGARLIVVDPRKTRLARLADGTVMVAYTGLREIYVERLRCPEITAPASAAAAATAAEQLKVPIAKCIVVGDSVWDLLAARRASALGVGLLSGGYGREELERAGAYRTYHDPADLLRHLDECGVRPAPLM